MKHTQSLRGFLASFLVLIVSFSVSALADDKVRDERISIAFGAYSPVAPEIRADADIELSSILRLPENKIQFIQIAQSKSYEKCSLECTIEKARAKKADLLFATALESRPNGVRQVFRLIDNFSKAEIDSYAVEGRSKGRVRLDSDLIPRHILLNAGILNDSMPQPTLEKLPPLSYPTVDIENIPAPKSVLLSRAGFGGVVVGGSLALIFKIMQSRAYGQYIGATAPASAMGYRSDADRYFDYMTLSFAGTLVSGAVWVVDRTILSR